MLQNTKELYGHKLSAIDGEIGQVKDFYFDDKKWMVRYLVADTGSWLTGRQVLVSPLAFGGWDQFGRSLHLKLMRKQIEDGPSVESHQPVSRQHEVAYHRYYGWPAYWNTGALFGLGGSPVILPKSKDEMDADENRSQSEKSDKHLQSTQEITGYQVQSGNETIGHLSGFLVDDKTWTIHKLVVETGHWYSGNELLISPKVVERISTSESKVFVSISIGEIQHDSDKNQVTPASGDSSEGNPTIPEMTRASQASKPVESFFSLPFSGSLSTPT